jgi:hypothetical protein
MYYVQRVPLLPSSPRARRRLRWIAAAAVLVAAGLAIAVAIPGHDAGKGTPTVDEGPAQVAITTRTRLTAADRRQIDATLDRFIPAGMERRDPALAWSLAGPEMRTDSSLADWRKGTSPIPYYQPKEKTFHDWQTIDVGPRYVIFNLLLHPLHPERIGTYVFSGQMVKPGKQWLVNRLYTIAIMNGPQYSTTHELGPADFAAPGAKGQGPPEAVKHNLGMLPIVLILALVLLVPLGVGLGVLVRARRWRRHVRTEARTSLPPLPSGYLRTSEERRDQAERH